MGRKPNQLRRLCLLFTLTITLYQQAMASATGISHFYDTDQLSSNLITSVCQDSQGFIWISTEYGLNRFDGIHSTSFYADDESAQPLLNNNIRKVICDNDGRVWVLSFKGLQCFDQLSNSFPAVHIDGIDHTFPTDMIVMRDGRLLLLTTDRGLSFVDTGKMISEQWTDANKLYTDETATCMFEDSRGRIWICSDKSGLTQLDIKASQSIHFDRSQLFSNGTNDVCEDGKGRIIVLSRSKVLLYDEKTKGLHIIGDASNLYLRKLFRTKEGKVLVGTYGSGLLTVDIENNRLVPCLQQTVEGVNLATQSIQTYFEDMQQNKWIGCYHVGIAFLSDQQLPFHFYDIQSLQQDNGGVVSLLTYDTDHFVWGQENNGLINVARDGSVIGRQFPGMYIISYHRADPDHLWIGTYGKGAGIVRAGSVQPIMIDSLNGKRIRDITTDKEGNVYLGIFDYGLLSYSADGNRQRTLVNGKLQLRNRYLNKLFVDSKGWLWIGHYNGIDVYDTKGDQLVGVPVDSVLRNSHTFAILESKDGLIWAGTNHGLFCYDRNKEEWQHFDKGDGLCNEIVCGIVEDDGGDLWISTYRGLSHFLRKTNKFVNFYKGNGLVSTNYIRGFYGKMPNGKIYFGNDHGVTYFSAELAAKTSFTNAPFLTGLIVAGKEVGTDGEHIKLNYQDNTFTLRFSTMDYREAGNVQYEYRFADEKNDVWHQLPPGGSDMILSHLRYGNHQLQVRALDNGTYSPVKEIAIQITPPWYRSWWAYVLYALLATIIIFMVLQNIRHKQLADMNEEKIKFFVDISHELRSPLTLIKSPLDKLLQQAHDTNETRALRNMKRNTDRMLTLVNQILSIRKIEKGQMKLHFAETDLGEFVEDICHDFDYQTEARKISLICSKPDSPLMVWIDREHFDKVVTNLITNAFKYVPDGGEIHVALRTADSIKAELMVSDNGAGIDEEMLKKVFDRFYQTSARPAAGQMGYGIGLNLTQKLTTLHGGTIVARNRTDGQGSEFVVQLPLGNKHLPQAQLVDADYFADTTEQKSKQSPITIGEHTRKVRTRTNYQVAVVDDDADICTFLKTELGETYNVLTYPNGKDALTGIVETVPDLIISDVIMPEMDGITLLKRIKTSTKLSHIPVILLTSKSEHQALIKGLEEGAEAYIDKPFNLEELEARVASLIANRLRVKGKFSGAQEQEDTIRQIELKGINEELMQRIMKVVNERIDDSDFNVEALSDAVGVSRSQLHRRVKDITGISVGEFIRNLRLQQAARLLEKGDTSIAQVTYATGFSNPTHFSTAFKKHFGVSPSEYMNRHNSETKQ